MSDIRLFRLDGGKGEEVPGSASVLEKSLQTLIENNLETLLGVRLVKSEHYTGLKHGGRVDTLGIDENDGPVIIEYKRATNENVINQGLFYLDWLIDHKAEFQLLVEKAIGRDVAEKIDWEERRLICIAGGFTRYDEHAIQQIDRTIDLIQYRRFGDNLLMLELVNASTGGETVSEETTTAPTPTYRTISQTLDGMQGTLRDLYDELRAYLKALGGDVQEKVTMYYVAFKRIKNFACVEVHPGKGAVTVFLKVDPDLLPLVPGFTRDVREIGHFGTGDLEVTLRNREDLEKAKPLIQQSYEAS